MARTTFKGPVRSLSGFISTGDVMGQALSAGTVDGGTDVTGIDLYQGRCMTIGNTTTVFNLPEIVSDSAVNPSTLSTIGLEYTFLLTANLSGETFTLNAGTAAGRSTADVFQGTASYVDTADNSMEGFNAAGTDTLTLDGSTRGGLGGSIVYCRSVGANIWLIDCSLNGSGTMVTPWS
jgi:hypothetical protein|tara:strand:- start:615 stop:1148 length:534 start_codon:yes stop_codon:yes gene_type:complete